MRERSYKAGTFKINTSQWQNDIGVRRQEQGCWLRYQIGSEAVAA